MSAGAVRAGGVFVEIGADPRKFFSALTRVNKSLGNMGRSLVSGGGRLVAAGIGMAAPIAAAVQQGAAFESTLLNIRASTGATSAQIDEIKASSMAMSQALGVGPTEAAQGMLELLKAGMSLDSVLGGAGKTALEFAKVGEMDVAQAAVVMSDAMNVFKVSSDVAANALSSAADASSTSIAEMSQAFSMSSAVAGKAGLSIEDLSGTLAILANNGVKGSDAGTSIKTMLMRLMAPASEAADAMAGVGLSVRSFVNQDTGKMLPMVDIIGKLGEAMKPLDEVAKKELLAKIFGADAIRAALILGDVGVAGFKDIQKAMSSALPVGEKYKILMSGLAGSAGNVLAALQRMAIAVSEAVAPALASVVPFITGFIDGLTKLATDNKEAVVAFAKLAVAAVAVGSAMVGLGISLQVTSFGFAGIGKAAAFALSPLTMLIAAASKVGTSFALVAMPETLKLTSTIGSSMLAASASVLSFAATAGGAMAGFATSSATALAVFAASSAAGFVRMSVAASVAAQAMFPVFFTGFNRGIAAGAGFFAATLRGLNGVVMASSALRGALFAVSGSGMARFVGDIVGGLTLTYKSFVWWATGATARLAQYAVNVYMAAAATVTNAARMGAAWVASALPGLATFASAAAGVLARYVGSTVLAAAASVTSAVRSGLAWVASALPGVVAFVSGAVAGIGVYLGAAAMAVAGSVASAAAVAAAWLAPLAPLLLLSAAAVGVGVAVKQFGPQIAGAFSGLAGYAAEAGGAIAGGFSTAVSGGIVLLGDLAKTAMTTFGGIYDAVAVGDLASAMEIAMSGMQAAFFDVAGPFLTQVSEWATKFQGIFDDIGVEIAIAMERARGFFEKNVADVGNPQAWGAAPAIGGVPASSKEELEKRAEGIQSQTDRNVAAMESDARDRSSKRIAAASEYALSLSARGTAAKSSLSSLVSAKTETRAKNSQVDDLLASIKGATSVDQLAGVGGLGDQFSTLRDLGRLTSDQEMMLSDALDKAAEGLTVTATAGAKSAGDQSATSKAEVAGTFSSVNLGGMGFGSSLAERTAKAAEDTAKGVGQLVQQGQAGVAA
jgi:TP901 family phage tail tape measure protein